MTKEQIMQKWGDLSRPLKNDIDAVIATEIAKVQPEKTNKIEITPHTLVEVNRAFRALKQDRNSYIHKVFSDDGVFDAMNEIRQVHEAHYGPKKEEQPKLDPIEAWKQYKEENKPQPELNPIEQAYESGIKIRHKGWHENSWIQKLSETEAIDELKKTYDDTIWRFNTEPHKWELYTEPEQPAKPFDRERFERIFCAIVASGKTETWEQDFKGTIKTIEKLDAFYATKEKGGEND